MGWTFFPASFGIACLATVTACAGHAQGQALTAAPVSAKAASAAPADVASPPADARRTQSGLAMKVLEKGGGEVHPGDNDCVTMIFQAWRRDGSPFSSSDVAGDTSTQCLRPAMTGVAEALKLMVEGETARIWMPASLTHAVVAHHSEKRMIKTETANVDLTLDLQLLHILRAPPTPPSLKPAKGAVKLPSGVFMQILKPGAGHQHPSVTSWLRVDYTGWTSDGRLFESTALANLPALVLVGTTLPGWQASLQAMVAGEKVRLWIPAAMAYGEKPDNKFQPAGDLIYDIEILGFN